MSVVLDTTIEEGRFDVIYTDASAPTSVDVNLVLHVDSRDNEAFVRRLVNATVSTYGGSAHVRAKVYMAEFNSVLVYVTEAGWATWRSRLVGRAPDPKALRQHFASAVLSDYKGCITEYAERPFCTHEVAFSDGSAIYWAGQ
jgi:hypothetical protein